MPNRFFSGRIPENLDERAKQYCAETGESKTQVLINALSRYLDFPIEMPTTTGISIERFNQLEERVIQLEEKLKITGVSSTDNNVAIEKNETTDTNVDNNADITQQPDNKPINSDINGENIEPAQPPILGTEQDQEADQGDPINSLPNNERKPWIVRNKDVPNLPGLENMNKEQILNKLRNARSSGKTEVRIGQYLLKYYGKEKGTTSPLLWEVIIIDNDSDNL